MPHTIALTTPEATELGHVYHAPGWQFPCEPHAAIRTTLATLALLVNLGGNDWHVTTAGYDWMETHPWTN